MTPLDSVTRPFADLVVMGVLSGFAVALIWCSVLATAAPVSDFGKEG